MFFFLSFGTHRIVVIITVYFLQAYRFAVSEEKKSDAECHVAAGWSPPQMNMNF